LLSWQGGVHPPYRCYAYIVRGSTQGDASLRKNCSIRIFSAVVSLLMVVRRFLVLLFN
jgi:hypothetical protein